MTVMYPYSEGCRFDMDYYVNRHIAIHRQDPNVLGILVEEGKTPFRREGEPELVCAAHFFYESIGKLNESRTPEKAKIQLADIPNFTNIRPVNQISEVEYFKIPSIKRIEK
ncbi:MAG: EthD family reductase [Oscillospiraceae bacterium]